MGVEEGQDGQWTRRGEPKAAREGAQGVQMVGQGAQMVGQGVQRGPQREPQDHKKEVKKHI